MVDDTFNYSFVIKNKGNYQVTYYIDIDAITKESGDCTEENTYSGSFTGIEEGQKGVFYINFTNRIDYTKTIKRITFIKKTKLLSNSTNIIYGVP